jgi:hypothetical protein
VRRAGHVEERGIVRLEEVVVGRLMGERRHGRVAMPSRGWYASCGVLVLVAVVVKVLHDSARWGGSARQHTPWMPASESRCCETQQAIRWHLDLMVTISRLVLTRCEASPRVQCSLYRACRNPGPAARPAQGDQPVGYDAPSAFATVRQSQVEKPSCWLQVQRPRYQGSRRVVEFRG